MSRIGKKPIPIPKGVTIKVEGNTVLVQGPKGKLDTPLPAGIKVEQKDGNLVAIRENDSQAAVHGLARALVNNAVEGVTKGWIRDLEIVGIGYRAEMKGKGMVVFSLGFSHPIEYPLPTGVDAAVDRKSTRLNSSHLVISYAVFCLKKKNIIHRDGRMCHVILCDTQHDILRPEDGPVTDGHLPNTA